MKHLDDQIFAFYERLVTDINIEPEKTHIVASTVASETENLKSNSSIIEEIAKCSPISLTSRLNELIAYQAWSDFAYQSKQPFIVRTNIIVMSYISFIYLKDALFEVILKYTPDNSVSKKCAAYLTSGKVRDFRNAFSHANWEYAPNFRHLECWVLEDARNKSGLVRNFQVTQDDLDFWQTLSRGLGYSIYLTLLN